MSYEKTVWVNGQAPALDAEHLNKIEQGIADAVSVTPQSLTDGQKTQARNNIGAMQGIESADYPGCYYVLNDSTVEWINPPINLGVEYRTTERYLGKPVYCKLVDFGKLPNNAVKDVAHGISNLQYAISVTGESNGDNLIGNMYITYVNIGSTKIGIKTNADRSGVSATVLIKYTKTTD